MHLTLTKRRLGRLRNAVIKEKLMIQQRPSLIRFVKSFYGLCHVVDGYLSISAALLSSRELKKIRTKCFNGQSIKYFLDEENTLTTLDDLRRDVDVLMRLEATQDAALTLGRGHSAYRLATQLELLAVL